MKRTLALLTLGTLALADAATPAPSPYRASGSA